MYATHYGTPNFCLRSTFTHRVTRIVLGDAQFDLIPTSQLAEARVTSFCIYRVIDTGGQHRDTHRGRWPAAQFGGQPRRQARLRQQFRLPPLSAIDTPTSCAVDTIDVGGPPERLAVSPNGGRLYASDIWSGTSTVAPSCEPGQLISSYDWRLWTR